MKKQKVLPDIQVPDPHAPQQLPHQQPAPGTRLPTPQLNALNSARANFSAMKQSGLGPALGYTQQQASPSTEGWVESEETVHSKARSKEEFPQG